MNKSRKRIEASKKILIYCDTLLTITIIVMFVATFKNKSLDGISQVVISISALSAVAHSFYYWKAKAENLHKYGQGEDIDINDCNEEDL